MKKARKSADPDILPEYDFHGGVRGKYAKGYAEGSNVVLLAPDVMKVFPDSDSVNEALRLLIKVSERKSGTVRGKAAGSR
jgi:hypothetical protein